MAARQANREQPKILYQSNTEGAYVKEGRQRMSRQSRNVTQFGKVEMSPSDNLSSLLTLGDELSKLDPPSPMENMHRAVQPTSNRHFASSSRQRLAPP